MNISVPFDDRVHHTATIDEFDLGLIRSYLQHVKSDLFSEAATMDFIQLCRNMNIVDGPDEWVRPKNVGLMFFNPHPDKYFPQAQIDVVHFPEGPGADSFSEIPFKGPVHVMLRDALSHIRNQVIEEKVVKHADWPEADRFFNYPFAALEEALCNAVYHRSYEIREPIEVRILPDKIEVSSFPGIDPSIRKKDLKKLKFVSRRYRNRRIGEFLKELDMTEGRGTGIPKILREIKKNGSPLPIFHTDDDRTFLTVQFSIHQLFLKDVKTIQVTPQVTPQVEMLIRVMRGEMSRAEIMDSLGLKDREHFRLDYLKLAFKEEVIEMTIPDKSRSSKQKYRLTEKGKNIKQKGRNQWLKVIRYR